MQSKAVEELILSNLASVRLRSAVGAKAAERIGYRNQFTDGLDAEAPDLVIVGKIDCLSDHERSARWLARIKSLKLQGTQVVIDYTDHHLFQKSDASKFYASALPFTDEIVCSSNYLAEYISKYFSSQISIIEDPVEVPILPPSKKFHEIPTAFWFGHSTNLPYLFDFLLNDYRLSQPCKLIAMTNLYPFPDDLVQMLDRKNLRALDIQVVPWGVDEMTEAAALADVCWLPAGLTDPRKSGASSNRLLTALALGLPTAADPLASYSAFKAFHLNLRSSDLSRQLCNPESYFAQVLAGQDIIRKKFTPEVIGLDWLSLIDRVTRGKIRPYSSEFKQKQSLTSTKTKKIAIATAAYNQKNFVSKLVGSTDNYRTDSIVHYVQDDCSNDGTYAALTQAANENRIILSRTEKNLGPRGNIASLLDKIDSDYVVFSGGDDYIHPPTIQKLSEELQKNDDDTDIFVYLCIHAPEKTSYQLSISDKLSDVSTLSGARNSQAIEKIWSSAGEMLCTAALLPGFLWAQGMVIKTSLAKEAGFLPDGNIDDWGLQHNLAVIAMKRPLKIKYRKEILSVLSVTPGSYGSDVTRQLERQVRAINAHWHPNLRKTALLNCVEKKIRQYRSESFSYEEVYQSFSKALN